LKQGNPWEIERPDVTYPVRFGGQTKKWFEHGIERTEWLGGELVIA